MQMKALAILLLCVIVFIAGMETNEAEQAEVNDADHCVADERIAKTCLKCSSLPFYALPPLVTCCSEKRAFLFCEACVNDQESCETLMKEIEAVDMFTDGDDYYDDEDNVNDSLEGQLEPNEDPYPYPLTSTVDKRFGRLYVNRNPKRYGRLFFGKRSEGNSDETADEMTKRYGRLYMGRGSYFGKRDDIDKRYGRLFTSSNSYFGKRGNADDSESQDTSYGPDESDDFEIAKRYGRIYMGGRNKMFGKRYGRIFFGKRNGDDMDKRYGQLYLGQNRYFLRNPAYMNLDKRFGRLFTGRRNYYFGKR